jgi:Ca2+/Na+ antiporter
MFKFFIVAAAVFGYAFLVDGKINKPSVFTLMGLYLVYTFVETRALLQQTKKSNNG